MGYYTRLQFKSKVKPEFEVVFSTLLRVGSWTKTAFSLSGLIEEQTL